MKILILFFAVILLSGCGANFDKVFEPIKTEQQVQIPNQSKSDIFDKARQWFSEYFVSGESVLDYADKDSGTLIGKGFIGRLGGIPIISVSYGVKFSLRVDIKDGVIKLTTTILQHTNTDSKHTYVAAIGIEQERNDAAHKAIELMLDDLKRSILENKGW